MAIDHPCDPMGPLGDFDPKDYSRQAETLQAIHVVLEIIGRTPNAYINREALVALGTEAELGTFMLCQDWVDAVVERDTPFDLQMPF